MAETTNRTEKKKFSWRGTASLLTATSFLVMTITGIALYISPQGRVARWADWRFWGLDKEQWGAVHTTSSLLFVIAACAHLYFNWQVFVHYIHVARQFNLKREMIVTLVITAIVIAGTIWEVPPFGSIIEGGERIKAYWEARSYEAPYAHAEASTIDEFAQQTGIDEAQLRTRLTALGVDVNEPGLTIGGAAEQLGLSPGALFEQLGTTAGRGSGSGGSGGSGSGFGRQTLQQVCLASGVDIEQAVTTLKAEGIEARSGETLRDIADRAGVRPPDIAAMINTMAGN